MPGDRFMGMLELLAARCIGEPAGGAQHTGGTNQRALPSDHAVLLIGAPSAQGALRLVMARFQTDWRRRDEQPVARLSDAQSSRLQHRVCDSRRVDAADGLAMLIHGRGQRAGLNLGTTEHRSNEIDHEFPLRLSSLWITICTSQTPAGPSRIG